MTYFAYRERYRLKYPIVTLESEEFIQYESKFIIDPALEINIIKESAVVPHLLTEPTYYFLKRGSLTTSGQTTLNCGENKIKFQITPYSSNIGIAGILGAPYLNQLFDTQFFTRTLIEGDLFDPPPIIINPKTQKNKNSRKLKFALFALGTIATSVTLTYLISSCIASY